MRPSIASAFEMSSAPHCPAAGPPHEARASRSNTGLRSQESSPSWVPIAANNPGFAWQSLECANPNPDTFVRSNALRACAGRVGSRSTRRDTPSPRSSSPSGSIPGSCRANSSTPTRRSRSRVGASLRAGRPRNGGNGGVGCELPGDGEHERAVTQARSWQRRRQEAAMSRACEAQGNV